MDFLLSLHPLILQATEVITRPDIAYDIAKQLGTIGAVVGLLWLILKGKQKAIDDEAARLASELEKFRVQVAAQITKLETDLKEELKQFDLDYRETDKRVREIEKNYISRFEELKDKINDLALEVRQVLTEFKQFKQG